MFNFVLLCPKRCFEFNSRIVRTQFSSVMILNNWKIIAGTQSYIFRWRSCFRRRRVCLSCLMTVQWWLQDESECLINTLTMFNYMKLTTKKKQQQQKVANTKQIKIMVCRWLVSPLLFVSVCDAAAHKDCISKSSACLTSPGQRAKFPGTSPFRPNVNLRNPFGKSASTNTPPSTLSPDLSKSRKTSAPARMRAGWWSW